jgi:hypothetical protein
MERQREILLEEGTEKRGSGRPPLNYKRISAKQYKKIEEEIRAIIPESDNVDEYTDFYFKLRRILPNYDYKTCLAFILKIKGYTYKQIGDFFNTSKQNIHEKLIKLRNKLK